MSTRQLLGFASGALVALCLLMLAPAQALAAGDAEFVVTRQSLLTSFGSYTYQTQLPSRWRYRPGDDPAYADPSIDDADWPLADVAMIGGEAPEGWPGVGWFRLWLEVAPELDGVPIGIIVKCFGRSELYVDGAYHHGAGESRADGSAREPSYVASGLDAMPKVLTLSKGRHLLAVRFETGLALRIAAMEGFLAGPTVALVDLDRTAAQRLKLVANNAASLAFASGAAIAVSILQLFWFVRDRRHRPRLYFGGGVGLLGVATAAACVPFLGLLTLNGPQTYGYFIFIRVVFALSMYALWRFAASLETVPRPRLTRLWGWATVAMVLGAPWLPAAIAYGTMLLLVVDQVRLVALAAVRKAPGARVLGLGLCVFTLGIAVDLSPALTGVVLLDFSLFAVGLALYVSASSVTVAEAVAATEERLAHNVVAMRDLERAHGALRAAQSKLVQSEKMASLGRLVAGVAHELNTPIGVIVSSRDSMARALELLAGAKDQGDDKRRDKALRVLEQGIGVLGGASERVSGIVARMRGFARLDEAERKRVDLREGVRDTLAVLRHELTGSELREQLDEVPPILCNPAQLNQLLANLLLNARQALPAAGGSIEIATRRVGDTIRLSVRDDGCGIAPEHLGKIFDPGFTTKGVGVGVGLGLAVAHEVAREHGGELEVDSGPGEGATFTLILPIERTRVEAVA